MVLHGGSLTGDPTAIGAHQRVVAILWPVNVGHYLVRSFEGTVRTNVVLFDECQFEQIGCLEKFSREDLEEHMREKAQTHLTMMAATSVKMQQEFQAKLQEQERRFEGRCSAQEEEFQAKLQEQERRFEGRCSA